MKKIKYLSLAFLIILILIGLINLGDTEEYISTNEVLTDVATQYKGEEPAAFRSPLELGEYKILDQFSYQQIIGDDTFAKKVGNITEGEILVSENYLTGYFNHTEINQKIKFEGEIEPSEDLLNENNLLAELEDGQKINIIATVYLDDMGMLVLNGNFVYEGSNYEVSFIAEGV